MLAKAVATEAGANFINISMSSITSKVFGLFYLCLEHTADYVDPFFFEQVNLGYFLSNVLNGYKQNKNSQGNRLKVAHCVLLRHTILQPTKPASFKKLV